MSARAQPRPAPSEPMRLTIAGLVALAKGAVVSAIVVAPFFGPWPAIATAGGFAGFCVWLTRRKGPASHATPPIQEDAA